MDGIVTVSATGDHLTLRFPDGAQHRFHAVWLRDHIPNSASQQSLCDVPVDVRIQSAKALAGEVKIDFAPDGHSATYPILWLKRYAYDADQGAGFHLPEEVFTWDKSSTDLHRHAQLSDRERAIRLKHLGVAFVQDGWTGATGDLPSVAPGTLPYTAQPYLASPPRYSVVHLPETASEPATLRLVDGFRLAEVLRDKSLSGFNLLTKYPLRYRAEQEQTQGASGALLRIAPDGQLRSIRYDSRHIAPVVDVPFPRLLPFYAAYRQFLDLAARPDLAVEITLHPGEGVLLDNHRILRSARAAEQGGGRHLAEYPLSTSDFNGQTPEPRNWLAAAE